TGSFNWTPTFIQSGLYTVKFVATDGARRDSEFVSITIIEAGNQRPVLAAIGPKAGTEGTNLNFNISATDPDASIPAFVAISLPIGATFINNGNGTGSFSWTPNFTQAGIYNVTFIASDGVLADSEIVTISIADVGNQAPVLATIGARNVTEGLNLNFIISASDPDGTTPSFTTSTLPTGATFINNGNGTGTFNWTPTFVQAGVYNITFRASDGFLVDTEVVQITVNDAGNQFPVLATIGQKTVLEGTNLNFNTSATDPDGTIPTLSATDLPTGATFVNNGNGTGTFNWSPTFTQAGTYFVFFFASDGAAVDSEVVRITVNEAGNQIPVLAAIGPKITNEGVNLAFGVSATDADNTIPSLFTSTLPTGAIFLNNGNGTGTFNWNPNFSQSGIYNITFFASDGAARDSEIVTITVVDGGNQPPVLAAIGNKIVTEGNLLNFNISATDIDGTIPVLASSTLPTLATFVNNGNGTGSFNWTPAFVQSGIYVITFYASDGITLDTEAITITVNEAGNQAPILASIGNKTSVEGVNLSFPIFATDPDSTIAIFTTSTRPTGAVFVDSLNGRGSFSWTPSFTQSGIYNVTFRATDGQGRVDSETVTITVGEAGNQPPILAAIGAQTTTENVALGFVISAVDPEGIMPSLTTSALPAGATFVNNGNGTGNFDWTPTYLQSGIYNVTFRASDGFSVDSEVVAITVIDAGNQAPVLANVSD
ncbi:MAG: putative Ig domain-containing protein, partial [Candidatus Zixiibacteriota bacterium]